MKKKTADRCAAALAARSGSDYDDLARRFNLPEAKLEPRAGLAVDFPHDLTPSGVGHGVILDVTARQILVRTALDAAPVWIPISMRVTERHGNQHHTALYTVQLSYTPYERDVRKANLDQVAGALAAVLASYADYDQAPTALAPTEQLSLF